VVSLERVYLHVLSASSGLSSNAPPRGLSPTTRAGASGDSTDGNDWRAQTLEWIALGFSQPTFLGPKPRLWGSCLRRPMYRYLTEDTLHALQNFLGTAAGRTSDEIRGRVLTGGDARRPMSQEARTGVAGCGTWKGDGEDDAMGDWHRRGSGAEP
jgi:hypothetical protein